MRKIDWSAAPDGAECFAYKLFWKAGAESGVYFWFNGQEWAIDAVGTNPFLSDDCHVKQKEWPTDDRINNIGLNRTTEDTGHYEQAEKPQGNKYDRTIHGKYGTGKCTVDVYRVLDAFDTGNPAIDHAVKKLLCAGNRGAKDKLQDLQEAIQSIQAAIDLMKDKENGTN